MKIKDTNNQTSITKNASYLKDISAMRQFVSSKRASGFNEAMKHFDPQTLQFVNDKGQFVYSEDFNCFGFAMGLTPLDHPDVTKTFLQLCSDDDNDETLPLDNFLQIVHDMNLDIEEIDKDNIAPLKNDNEWYVGFYMSPYDFHFTRQLPDGRWAGKHGWCGYYEMYEKLPNLIYHMVHDYTLISVFKVSIKQSELTR